MKTMIAAPIVAEFDIFLTQMLIKFESCYDEHYDEHYDDHYNEHYNEHYDEHYNDQQEDFALQD